MKITPFIFDANLEKTQQIWKFCKQFSCSLWLLQENMQELIINCDEFSNSPQVYLQTIMKVNRETFILYFKSKSRSNSIGMQVSVKNKHMKSWLLGRMLALKQKIFSPGNDEIIVKGQLSYVEQGLFTRKLSQFTNLTISYQRMSQKFEEEEEVEEQGENPNESNAEPLTQINEPNEIIEYPGGPKLPVSNAEPLAQIRGPDKIIEYPGGPKLPDSSHFFPMPQNLVLPQAPAISKPTASPPENFQHLPAPGILKPMPNPPEYFQHPLDQGIFVPMPNPRENFQNPPAPGILKPMPNPPEYFQHPLDQGIFVPMPNPPENFQNLPAPGIFKTIPNFTQPITFSNIAAANTYKATPNFNLPENYSNLVPQASNTGVGLINLQQPINFTKIDSPFNPDPQKIINNSETGKFAENSEINSVQVPQINNQISEEKKRPPPSLLKKKDNLADTPSVENANLNNSRISFNAAVPPPNLNYITPRPKDDIKGSGTAEKSSENLKNPALIPSESKDSPKVNEGKTEVTFNSKFNSIETDPNQRSDLPKANNLSQALPPVALQGNSPILQPSISSEPLNPPPVKNQVPEKSSIMNPIIVNSNKDPQENSPVLPKANPVGLPIFNPLRKVAPQSYFPSISSSTNVSSLINQNSDRSTLVPVTINNYNPNQKTLPTENLKGMGSVLPPFYVENNPVNLGKPERIFDPPSFKLPIEPPFKVMPNPEPLKQSSINSFPEESKQPIVINFPKTEADYFPDKSNISYGLNCSDCNITENEPYISLSCGCFNCYTCIQLAFLSQECMNCKEPLKNDEVNSLIPIFQDLL